MNPLVASCVGRQLGAAPDARFARAGERQVVMAVATRSRSAMVRIPYTARGVMEPSGRRASVFQSIGVRDSRALRDSPSRSFTID